MMHKHGCRSPLAALIVSAALVSAAALVPGPALAQTSQAAEHLLAALPEISFTCPMHPDVIEGEAGSCPICKMDLVTTRIELAYTCPVHGVIHSHEPGVCPIGGRTLQTVTLTLVWACPEHAAVSESEPGFCRLGEEALELKWMARAHGDHNPKYGGLFYMAPDSWHHLEGTYPEPGLFRVHVYDDFTKPMNAGQIKGRVVTREVFDAETRQTRELASYPLLPVQGGLYLEARVERLEMPATLIAKVKFEPGGDEARFDFTFAELSVAPQTGLDTALTPSGTTASAAVSAVPDAAEDIVIELAMRHLRLQQLVRRGALDEIYIPALEAKDLALALETKADVLAPDTQQTIRLAVKRLVRAAWMLDGFGDLGNRQGVEESSAMFDEAMREIKSVYDIP